MKCRNWMYSNNRVCSSSYTRRPVSILYKTSSFHSTQDVQFPFYTRRPVSILQKTSSFHSTQNVQFPFYTRSPVSILQKTSSFHSTQDAQFPIMWEWEVDREERGPVGGRHSFSSSQSRPCLRALNMSLHTSLSLLYFLLCLARSVPLVTSSHL